MKGVTGRVPFGALAQEVFLLDAGIEWIALEEACCEPRWAWRVDNVCVDTTMNEVRLIDPLLFILAEGGYDLRRKERIANPHRLLFVVFAYADKVQIVAPLGAYAHVSVTVSNGIDACVLGEKLSNLLDRYAQSCIGAAGNASA